ncbi:MAG TPA: alpha/beta hydrolase [Candidatus Binataceae bacterium]|nr:alpha/beta hydrolase [Candidatus Binataceae bacterium]
MRVQVGDVRMFFDVEGAKLRPDGQTMREVPTLILLHGGPGFDHSVFKPDLSGLADIVQIVYIDHRGNGRSDRSSAEKWNLDQWGDDLQAFCNALEIERPIVMGESFGGMVAMSYAARHPGHPAKLILASTSAKIRPDRSIKVFERLGGKDARDVAERFFEDPSPDKMAAYIEKCLPLYNQRPRSAGWMQRSVQNFELTEYFFKGEIRTFDLLPHLARIKCPTLITAGEQDPITPIESSEDIARAIPAGLARLERFENAGHGTHHDEPEHFDRVVREFISS